MKTPEIHRNPQLEATLHWNHYESSPWAVYGDWLQTVADPRGELIALDLALKEAPKNKNLKDRYLTLLQSYHKDWMQDFSFNFTSKKNNLVSRWTQDEKRSLKLKWQYGFVRSLTITLSPDENYKNLLVPLEKLFRSNSILFLEKLHIDVNTHHFRESSADGLSPETVYNQIFQKVALAGTLPHLRKFQLGYFLHEATKELDIAPLLSLFPNLDNLDISGNFPLSSFSNQKVKTLGIRTNVLNSDWQKALASPTFPKLWALYMSVTFGYRTNASQTLNLDFLTTSEPLRNLCHLHLYSNSMNKACIETLCKMKLPHLNSLCLEIGGRVNLDPESFLPFFWKTNLPALKSLWIRYPGHNSRILQELVESPMLKNLNSLSLALCSLTQTDVNLLLERYESFRHLEEIDLHSTGLSSFMKTKLKEAYGERVDVSEYEG